MVEHDESIIRAAEYVIELGPKPGVNGGRVTFQGPRSALLRNRSSITAAYLSGIRNTPIPKKRRPVMPRAGAGVGRGTDRGSWLAIRKATKHNIRNLSFRIPLNRLVCLSGVSGSGKSTLLDNVIYQSLQSRFGKVVQDPASIEGTEAPEELSEVVLVDQSPVSRTPRSNPALYTGAWGPIRELFARTEEARA